MDDILQNGHKLLHPGLSVDCVIFGFHGNQLKVLLLRMKHAAQWALPGGFVRKEEDVDDAAVRVLQSRTGLEDVFLRQFYLFGEVARSEPNLNGEMMVRQGKAPDQDHWLRQRFVSMGYYALVDFQTAVPRPDPISDACAWWDLQQVPVLALDHSQILAKALETLRRQLTYQPIGYNLLPEKFTMPELQKLYETILNKALDRRNFQRKMLGYGILKRLEERKSGGAHKAPYLYSFDKERYQLALQDGLQQGW
ncbi:NUDIX hydrolase [Pontibacter liquoris]|uniref:NUDIX hydrolase n=1 Tax=Pontibacter liquoris TaxID=2905677 RepID=UPI001FA6F3B6|nr:NUDIX domain-containing protein [Pontibacter liquoris]